MLLYGFKGRAAATIDADPDDVFATITAVDRLPDWNARIASVTEPPPDPSLPVDTEWVVQMVVPPARWKSRARVLTHDRARRCFEHVSNSDDGNPSHVLWRWTVSPDVRGSIVTVDWEVHIETFWRRLVFGRLRRYQLAREVPSSLAALAYHSAPREPAA